MTVHDLHDALNLLPSDLITAADKVRTTPKTTVIHWRRWISLAACLALLILGAGQLLFNDSLLNHVVMQKETAAEAPAAAAPMAPRPAEQEIAADEAIPEEPAAEATSAEAPAEMGGASNSTVMGADKKDAEEELCIDHSHRFAEETTGDSPAVGYCGNTMTIIYMDGEEYSFAGSDSIAVTDILINLSYDPNEVCRCMAEFTVDTEMILGIEVNLTEGFARCETGQAALTEKQAQTIQEIVDRLS